MKTNSFARSQLRFSAQSLSNEAKFLRKHVNF